MTDTQPHMIISMKSYDLLYLQGESYTCTILFVTLNAKSISLKLVDHHKQKPPPSVSAKKALLSKG